MSSPLNMPRGPLMADVEGLSLTNTEAQALRHPSIGAVILFTRNYQSPNQIARLIGQIKSLREPSLLVAVDQEGGRVQRFREGFCQLPPLHFLGGRYDTDSASACDLAFDAGRLMAAELRRVDIDFSFAPVLDIADLNSQIIGDRGLHHNPHVIHQLAGHYIDGMNSAGMVATGKHFPGHGGVLADSHHELPVDRRTLDEVESSDLKPYAALVDKLGGVMTAHVLFENIDSQLPTFSSFWINRVLREKVGFKGIVFSDDLTMEGATVAGSMLDRVDKALAAGCDMVLVCNDPASAEAVANHLESHPSPNAPRLDKMAGTNCDVSLTEIACLNRQFAA